MKVIEKGQYKFKIAYCRSCWSTLKFERVDEEREYIDDVGIVTSFVICPVCGAKIDTKGLHEQIPFNRELEEDYE